MWDWTARPFQITYESLHQAKLHAGQILYMYHDTTDDYSMIGHNVDYEDIPISSLLFCTADRYHQDRLDLAEFLVHGAEVALCCHLYNLLSDEQRDRGLETFLRQALVDFRELMSEQTKELIEVALLALSEDRDAGFELLPYGSRLYAMMELIYTRNVLGYYARMKRSASERFG